jgi:hypothetical protein
MLKSKKGFQFEPKKIKPGMESEAKVLEAKLNADFLMVRSRGYGKKQAQDYAMKMNIILIQRVSV